MGKKARASADRDPLGPLRMEFGGPYAARLFGAILATVAGSVLVGVGLFVLADGTAVLIAGGVAVAAGIATFLLEWRMSRERLQVRKKGVRLVGRRESVDLRWDEMTRVSIDKAIGRGQVTEFVHHDLGIVTYRGKGVLYTFAFRSEFDRIVASAALIRRGPDPQSLLKLVEKIVEPKLVTVREPAVAAELD